MPKFQCWFHSQSLTIEVEAESAEDAKYMAENDIKDFVEKQNYELIDFYDTLRPCYEVDELDENGKFMKATVFIQRQSDNDCTEYRTSN